MVYCEIVQVLIAPETQGRVTCTHAIDEVFAVPAVCLRRHIIVSFVSLHVLETGVWKSALEHGLGMGWCFVEL